MSLRSLPRAMDDDVRTSNGGPPLSRYSTFDPIGARALSVASETLLAAAAPPLTRASGETPLPTLSIAVLSITLLGEFLTANASLPFILFMVKGFTDMEGVDDVSSFAGALVASFFVGQFVTSLLWANIAERVNNRFVLTVSLFGMTITCGLFGMSTSLTQATIIRFAQGVFAGAIGVARGCVSGVTDASNESRAYAILGFCWGLGGVAGAVIGGLFESPALKWPAVFASSPLLIDYPYLLPTVIAASVTFTGALLSLFLAPDGGPRIHTIPQRMEKPAAFSLPQTIPEEMPLLSTTHVDHETDVETNARPTRSLRGYGAASSMRAASRRRSVESTSPRLRRTATVSRHSLREDGGFVERFALANENNVTTISDLWTAAAMSTNVRDSVHNDSEDHALPVHNDQDDHIVYPDDEPSRVPLAARTISLVKTLSWADLFPPHEESGDPASTVPKMPPFPAGKGPLPSDFGAYARPMRRQTRAPSLSRRARALSRTRTQSTAGGWGTGLGARTLSLTHPRFFEEEDEEDDDQDDDASPLWSIPWLVIAQYGILALHSTAHDMFFMSYFVSDREAGGLNLTASDFSILTATMCLFQIAYQFYLYPILGTRISHLAMLQLGTALFCIAYVASPALHVFAIARESGEDLAVGLLVVSAIRYCGSTMAYTSVAILVNQLSPPPIVGLANGVAQSIISFARIAGPLFGGYIWATALEGNPSGYFIPFFSVGGMCTFALVTSLAIR
ncbi:major facilitator superfamily MFS-1 [Peniophora sp. CONT]|nr:major facilitator superfamily MFS-1 [Peniophora sp. CONT]